jgi:hypothetical protein
MYASGFLVVSTFLETYSLREASVELWKSRYVHIGLLCLLLPVISNSTFYNVRLLVKARHEMTPVPHLEARTLLTALTYLILEIAFFVFAIFGRRFGTSEHVQGFETLGLMLGIAILLPGVAALCERMPEILKTKWVESQHLSEKMYRKAEPLLHRAALLLRGLTFATQAIGVVVVLFEYRAVLIDMALSHGVALAAYFLFTFLVGYVPWRTYSAIAAERISKEMVRHAWILAFCLMIPTYYLALMSFSYSVFPFIPAVRGGGDYTTAPMVIAHLKSESAKQEGQTVRAMLLEETANAFFVADIKDAGGPCEWRSHFDKRPQIISISRETVSKLEFVSSPNGYVNCSVRQ